MDVKMERGTYCLPEQHDVTERSPDGGQDSRHFEICGRFGSIKTYLTSIGHHTLSMQSMV